MATETFGDIVVISDVGATANSYVSVADTLVYWSLDPYKKDNTYLEEDIAVSVIAATNQLNSEYWDKYNGYLYDTSYALHFPRTSVRDSRGVEITDYTTFPAELGRAVAMQAWYMLEEDRTSEVATSNVKKLEMDGLGSKEFFSTSQQMSLKKKVIHEEVEKILGPYISTGSGKYSSFLGRA